MNCTKIKRIIDEADRPDVFPLDAAGHVAECPDCQSFADERAKLRELTGSVARVTAPSNFNALLNERLSKVKSQKSSWLSPVGLMRLGTATAGLLVVFMALQYGGFFSTTTKENRNKSVLAGEKDDNTVAIEREPKRPEDTVTPGHEGVGEIPERGLSGRSAPRTLNIAASRIPRNAPQDGPPVLLVRDNHGEGALPMIPVSVGMQQQVLNASYGRQQPRSSDISY